MNIESLLNKIQTFQELVIKSGFKRDVIDYTSSVNLGQNQNLVFMKGISEKVKENLLIFENNSLDSELNIVLRDTKPFTSLNLLNELEELDKSKEIDANEYASNFINILNILHDGIQKNESEINLLKETFSKYVSDSELFEEDDEQALMSLIFKDLQSTGNLREFSKVLYRWNRTLIIYHTLLKSESPDDINLIQIQNGSIDVIFNIDIDVAIDFAELIRIGLKVYGAYLLYKSKKAREIIDSYLGNKKLIEMEIQREILMLDNIKDSIKKKVLLQHKESLKNDKKIDKTSVTKKAEEVAKVITDHIIKGNEVKLLTPQREVLDNDDDDRNLSDELRQETAIVRERYKQLNEKERQLLLDKYTIKEDEVKPK